MCPKDTFIDQNAIDTTKQKTESGNTFTCECRSACGEAETFGGFVVASYFVKKQNPASQILIFSGDIRSRFPGLNRFSSSFVNEIISRCANRDVRPFIPLDSGLRLQVEHNPFERHMIVAFLATHLFGSMELLVCCSLNPEYRRDHYR